MGELQPQQTELGFNSAREADGYHAWLQQREQVMKEMAQRLGLPLGHEVEVWLRDGTLLKGRLLLRDQAGTELIVGRVSFKASDIESCVRLD